jgi:hypothetical protein
MIVVGLIHEGDRRPPEEPPGDRSWDVPWRGLGWTAAFGGLMAAVPFTEHRAGGVAGYGVLLAAVTLGAWRLDRWAGRQYWRGLGEHRE